MPAAANKPRPPRPSSPFLPKIPFICFLDSLFVFVFPHYFNVDSPTQVTRDKRAADALHDCIRVTLHLLRGLALARRYGLDVSINKRMRCFGGADLGQVQRCHEEPGAFQLDDARLASLTHTGYPHRASLEQRLKLCIQLVRAAELFLDDLAPVNAPRDGPRLQPHLLLTMYPRPFDRDFAGGGRDQFCGGRRTVFGVSGVSKPEDIARIL
jgi:hypothetical protein